MEYTEQQLNEFREGFATRRRRQWIVASVIGLVLAGNLFMENRDGGTIFGLTGSIVAAVMIGVVVAALAFSFWNWRCPACNRYLGRAFNPRFCQGCGVSLHT